MRGNFETNRAGFEKFAGVALLRYKFDSNAGVFRCHTAISFQVLWRDESVVCLRVNCVSLAAASRQSRDQHVVDHRIC